MTDERKKYIVALEVSDGHALSFIAPWSGDPGRTCVIDNARRYDTISSATFGLARARKYGDFLTAQIMEVRK